MGALEKRVIFSKVVKWRRGAAHLQDFYKDLGWFFTNGKHEPVGPFKTKESALHALYKSKEEEDDS